MNRWVSGRWVSGSVGRRSAVGGSVVGGFNKTLHLSVKNRLSLFIVFSSSSLTTSGTLLIFVNNG